MVPWHHVIILTSAELSSFVINVWEKCSTRQWISSFLHVFDKMQFISGLGLQNGRRLHYDLLKALYWHSLYTPGKSYDAWGGLNYHKLIFLLFEIEIKSWCLLNVFNQKILYSHQRMISYATMKFPCVMGNFVVYHLKARVMNNKLKNINSWKAWSSVTWRTSFQINRLNNTQVRVWFRALYQTKAWNSTLFNTLKS